MVKSIEQCVMRCLGLAVFHVLNLVREPVARLPVMTTSPALVHPLGRGWISAGDTGAPNYDEFASDAEVTAAIAQRPTSVLGVEMPHRAPEAVRASHSFTQALPSAAQKLRQLCSSGAFQAVTDVVAPYRIITPQGPALGVFCMVDTDQISSAVDEPGLVIRNEDVFIDKVAERVALTQQLGTLASAVLLLHHARDAALHGFLTELTDRLGEPATSDIDEHGYIHQLWLLGPGVDRERLLRLSERGELIVADGNHRSLAAQLCKLPRFLAVVTTPQSVRIRAYHRLVRDLSSASFDDVLDQLRAGGAQLRVTATPTDTTAPVQPGEVLLYVQGRTVAVSFPAATQSRDLVESMDHTQIERELFHRVLGIDAGDKRITYVGGDYPISWLLAARYQFPLQCRPRGAGSTACAGACERLHRCQRCPRSDAPQEHVVHT